jgi:hypothetical protein
MRIAQSTCAVSLLAALALGCSNGVDNISTTVTLGNPDSLRYLLFPSQSLDPGVPAGVLLTWGAASDPNVTYYVVNAAQVGGSFSEIAQTGETSYFVPGTPANQYSIQSADNNGDLSSGTPPITVVTTQVLPPPDGLAEDSLNGGVALTWSADARLSNPSEFGYYRVYSEPAVVTGGTANCPAGAEGFVLEGSTVSEGYVVEGLTNGTTYCFGVTTVATLGQESGLSSWVVATPSASGPSFDRTSSPRMTVGVHRTPETVRR